MDLGRTRHGLFFAHLPPEKMLKAHVCRATGSLAPKIHNLVRLAKLSKLPFSKVHSTFLAGFDIYQLEGCYPDRLPTPPKKREAQKELQTVEEVLQYRKLIGRLWELRIEAPEAWRIEPIACGEREWLEDDSRAIIEIARREGKVITFQCLSPPATPAYFFATRNDCAVHPVRW